MLTRGVHDAADDEAADGRAGQMQRRALLHAGVLDQLPLGEEVRGQLDGATKTSPHHGGGDAPVQAEEALAFVNLPQPIPGIAIVVLRAHGPNGRITLKTGLYEEEGAPRSGADDAGGGAAEDVDGEVLGVFVG